MASFYKPVPASGRSNFDLINEAKLLPNTSRQLKGVFTKDQMPRLANNECAILNLANSTDKEGTHWVAAGIHQNQPWYFDSFGLGVPKEIERQLNASSSGIQIARVPKQIQSNQSKLCGDFALGACEAVASTPHGSTAANSLQRFVGYMDVPNLANNDYNIEERLKRFRSHHSSSGNIPYEFMSHY